MEVQTPWRVLALSDNDILELNDFWLRSPKQARLYFEIDEMSGEWTIRIQSECGEWRIGPYIDGSEARKLLYEIELVKRGVYRDKNDNVVMVELGNDVEVVIPNVNNPQLVLKFPKRASKR
jgi:hypothetical protein